jgi:hypothetical protein
MANSDGNEDTSQIPALLWEKTISYVIATLSIYATLRASQWDFVRPYLIYLIPLIIFIIFSLIALKRIMSIRTKNQQERYLENIFKSSSLEQEIKKYHNAKSRIFYSVIILSIIIFIILLQSSLFNTNNSISIHHISIFTNNIILMFKESTTIAQIFFIFILVDSLFELIPSLFIKDFKFFFAKQCSKIAMHKNDEVEKISYILQSLDCYNKYLENSLGLQIKDRNKIFDKIIMELSSADNNFIDVIYNAYDKGKLELIRVLYKKNITDIVLAEFTFLNKMRGLSDLIIPIITVAISIIGLMLKK